MVVARLEDEVTVKRLQRRGSRVELMVENPDYAPILINGPLTFEGLVVGLIRGGRALQKLPWISPCRCLFNERQVTGALPPDTGQWANDRFGRRLVGG